MQLRNKLKLTNQRDLILKFMEQNFNHPSVDDVFLAIRSKLPRISKKTVYDNLKCLSENNLIKEIKIQGVMRFEPIQDLHAHAICTSCKEIFDVEVGDLVNWEREASKKLNGFKVVSSAITFYGVCKICRR
ncbi:MAG: Fur family transcriptional regulator [Candidatus Woesearchaeota archaeon]